MQVVLDPFPMMQEKTLDRENFEIVVASSMYKARADLVASLRHDHQNISAFA